MAMHTPLVQHFLQEHSVYMPVLPLFDLVCFSHLRWDSIYQRPQHLMLQLVLIGPMVNIQAAALLQRRNVHYLGEKEYSELPAYLAGWNVALLPLVNNEITQYISPIETLEYMAAGKPVVSTAVPDVVRPYGRQKLTHIAQTESDFIAALEAALDEELPSYLEAVDTFLAQTSWDYTWNCMKDMIDKVIASKQDTAPQHLSM